MQILLIYRCIYLILLVRLFVTECYRVAEPIGLLTIVVCGKFSTNKTHGLSPYIGCYICHTVRHTVSSDPYAPNEYWWLYHRPTMSDHQVRRTINQPASGNIGSIQSIHISPENISITDISIIKIHSWWAPISPDMISDQVLGANLTPIHATWFAYP